MPQAAVIYARISQDRGGEALGVTRQLQDCRAEAARRGWPVLEEFVDDDVSAYSGKQRPAYRRMLDAIADGDADAVLVWHLDRLHRRPIELEEFVNVCQRAGVKDLVTLHGDVDLGTGDGLLMARLMAAVAANESDAKSRRGKRKMLEIAERGKPHAGGSRPFGFLADRVTLEPREADVIRTIVTRLLAGESLASITRWLQESDVPTVTGTEWRTPTVRTLLLSPRIAGQRTHLGQVIGDAVWPAIISPERHAQVLALLNDPARKEERTPRRYLLSGIVRCDLCGSTMVTGRNPDHGRRYVCRKSPDAPGCGRMTITADALEELVADAVLYRLDSPELAANLTGQHRDDHDALALAQEIAADTAQLDELAALFGARSISAPEWLAARRPIEERLTRNRRRQVQASGASALSEHIGNAAALRGKWPTLNLDRQAKIVRAIISQVRITSGTPGARRMSPSRVHIDWRL